MQELSQLTEAGITITERYSRLEKVEELNCKRED
jgi:hypothetical protein